MDRADFLDHVHNAFDHLHDVQQLRLNPLAKLLARGGQPLSGEGLRRLLLDAIHQLRPPPDVPPSSTSLRLYRYLCLRYLEGASHKNIAQEFIVSTRQARRYHLDALEAVASVLWETCRASQQPVGGDEDAEPPSADPETWVGSPVSGELLMSRFPSVDAVTDAKEVVTGVVEIASRLSDRLTGSLDLSLPTTLPPVAVDRVILRQTLLSLLGGAIEADPTRPLALVADHSDDTVRLLITARKTRRRPTSGAREDSAEVSSEAKALLAAARQLAELHGVGVKVGQPGDGFLPIEVVVPVTHPVTVLVIDDNPGVARLFELYLRGTIYRVVHAKTWRQALRLAEEVRPDVITLDVIMPSQDGWDILRQLKALPETSDTPVVVCSILPDRSLALAVGAADFLPKPVTQQSLLAALRRCQPPRHRERQG